jgi:adenosylhomocysteine nucleosidase
VTTRIPVRPFAAPAPKLAVIAALEIEARTLASLRRQPELRIYISGPGPARARTTAREAIADGAGALLSWGLAGGLRGDRSCGDVLVPARVLSSAGEWSTDLDWRREVVAVLGRRFRPSDEPLYSAERVVALPQAKAELSRRTGAAAVDMESAAVAAAAALAGLPCLIIRVVADGPADALPAGVEALVRDDGRTRPVGLWQTLLAPSQIPPLLKLARRSSVARRVLCEVARTFMERAN